MKWSWSALALIFLSSSLFAAQSALERKKPVAADQPIPTIDFFRGAAMRAPQLNDAGTHFVALRSTDEDQTEAMIYDVAKHTATIARLGSSHDIYHADWLTDDEMLLKLSKSKMYGYGLFALRLSQLDRSIPLDNFDVISVVGIPRLDRLHPVVWIERNALDYGKDGGVKTISAKGRFLDSAIDSQPGLVAPVEKTFPSIPVADGSPVSYLANSDGDLTYAIASKDGKNTLEILSDDHWQPSPLDLDKVDPVGAGEVVGQVLVLGERQSDKPRPLQFADAATGKLGEILYQDSNYEVSGHTYRRRADGRVLGLRVTQQATRSIWLDPEIDAIQAGAEKAIPGQIVRIVDFDAALKRFLIYSYSDRNPGQYYLYDKEQKGLLPVGSVAPWIEPARMRPMHVYKYQARDGRPIEAFLTFPANASKDNPPPLVVLPHGGPHARDSWGWDSEAQFLASRGYAVFQPNYRGSIGYDHLFPYEDRWAFLKMHQDVTDGVRSLISTKRVDPNRIAIMGSSFGGYLAICGAVYESGLYRCAVTISGVFDWDAMSKTMARDFDNPAGSGYFKRYIGDPEKDRAKFNEFSPLQHADQISIPVFVAHGHEDSTVPIAQSKRLVSALEAHKIPCETMFSVDEAHGFRHIETEVRLYEAIERFLAKNLAVRK